MSQCKKAIIADFLEGEGGGVGGAGGREKPNPSSQETFIKHLEEGSVRLRGKFLHD
jgi:hypothetical protein